ncbi:MAG: hypothetical protein IPO76_05095 [Elusimicrobia bacterium]|nr:hypothetical protein [Elusimicrobiota bacterium]
MTAVEWSGSVDAFNRSAGYVEIRQDHHGNGTLGPRSVEARTGLVYNGLAQVKRTSGRGGAVTRRTW